MEWKELFTIYWSQVTLLLLTIAYFIKRIFDLRSKKIETNHSLFQQNKITAVGSYYSAYAKVELMWLQLSIWKILSNDINAVELDDIIGPPLADLKKSILELKIYFSDADHIHFSNSLEKFLEINSQLKSLYFGVESDTNVSQKVTIFNAVKDKKIKENEDIINTISLLVRKSFNA